MSNSVMQWQVVIIAAMIFATASPFYLMLLENWEKGLDCGVVKRY